MSFLPARKAGEEGKVTEKITLGKDLPDKDVLNLQSSIMKLGTQPS